MRNRIKAAASLGLLLFVAGAARAQDAPLRLDERWTKGDALRYRFVEVESEGWRWDGEATPVMDPPGVLHRGCNEAWRRVLETRQRIVEVRADGEVTLALRIDAVKIDDLQAWSDDVSGGTSTTEAHLDTAARGRAGTTGSITAAVLKAVVGPEVTCRLRPDGRWPEVTGEIDDAIERALEPFRARDRAAGITDAQRATDLHEAEFVGRRLDPVSLGGLVRVLSAATIHPPARPLKPGEAWTQTSSPRVAHGASTLAETYTLRGFRDLHGRRSASIDERQSSTTTDAWGRTGSPSSGPDVSLVFDLARGRVVRYRSLLDAPWAPGSAFPSARSEVTAELLDDE